MQVNAMDMVPAEAGCGAANSTCTCTLLLIRQQHQCMVGTEEPELYAVLGKLALWPAPCH